MKLQKYLLSVAFVLVSIPICFGQTESKLVDEFGKMSNDPLQARVFYLMESLYKNNSRGLVALSAPKGNSLARYINERRIEGCLLWMKYDTSYLSYVFAERNDDILVQLWEVPQNAPKPQFNLVAHDYKLTDLSKPVRLSMLNVSDEYCPLRFDMEFYSRFLKANPKINGKIVIYEKTAKKYQKERLKYLRELTLKEKVSPKQINFARGKYEGVSDAEFWLIPAKKQ